MFAETENIFPREPRMNAQERSPSPIRITSILRDVLKAPFSLIASAIILTVAHGADCFAAEKWEGKATNLKGDFN